MSFLLTSGSKSRKRGRSTESVSVTYSKHDGVGQLDIVDVDSGNESY